MPLFKTRIRVLRAEQQWSQAKLAAHAYVLPPRISVVDPFRYATADAILAKDRLPVLRRFSKSMKGKPSRPGRPRSFGMSRRACLHSGDRVLTFPRPRENSARFAICN